MEKLPVMRKLVQRNKRSNEQGQMNMEYGLLTLSLDFELYWGVRDKRSIEQYKQNLQGTKQAIADMLHVFSENEIHATWATVGFLFFKNTDDLKSNYPAIFPTYKNEKYSPYRYIDRSDNLEAKYHFASELIELIKQYDGQEIGTHTFSHYYCLEDGQSLAEFVEDISSAIKIAKKEKISVKSIVFPRNQWNPEYLPALAGLNIQCYRGTESSWLYDASDEVDQGKIRRAIRLIDAYLNLSGHHTYELQHCITEKPFNFPSSRFLRPYSSKFSILDGLRLKRITRAMDDAAINHRIFHLWWHPHNFGINTKENINFLIKIINHYKALKCTYGMRSLNMGELCLLPGIAHG